MVFIDDRKEDLERSAKNLWNFFKERKHWRKTLEKAWYNTERFERKNENYAMSLYFYKKENGTKYRFLQKKSPYEMMRPQEPGKHDSLKAEG